MIRLMMAALLLTGCTSLVVTDDGCVMESVRRVAVTCGNASVISGQILVNDETVQALGRNAVDVVDERE